MWIMCGFLGIIGQDPSVSKSRCLHVVNIFPACLYDIEEHSIDSSSHMVGDFS